MKVIETSLKDCILIEPEIYEDDRGFFLESFQKRKYESFIPKKYEFVQDNVSYSKKNVLRGLHFQRNRPQGKLVRVLEGKVFDVAVDLRTSSETFGKHIGIVLDHKIQNQLWIPPGFAHGFVTLSDQVYLEYKCTDYYDPNDEETLIWNDDHLKIIWPVKAPHLSKKDSKGKSFSKLFK